MKKSEPVQFFYEYKTFTLRERTALKKFIKSIFRREGKGLSTLNYVFVSDKYLLEMNRTHLRHDYYTDIITFELSSTDRIEGEIYISVDRVRENAAILKQPFTRELHRVIFHGALHLCGFKDKTKKDAALMRAKEEEYLNHYFRKR